MGDRIVTRQHRLRTIGRLRLGTYDGRPKASQFFILTSPYEHYIQAAAETYGGTVEQWQPQGDGPSQWRLMNSDMVSIDAIIPPGKDPLDQAYEKWSAGGKQARCNGENAKIGKGTRPCVCRQRWGDRFWEEAPDGAACVLHTRLNVWLPDIPDVGVWLLETHGANAGDELPGFIDMLRATVGPSVAVPVRFYIVPKSKRVQGKLKRYIVVEAEVRGGLTPLQVAASIMAGTPVTPVLGAAEERLAIETGKRDYITEISQAKTRQEIGGIYRAAQADREVWSAKGPEIHKAANDRAAELDQAAEVWQRVIAAWDGDMAGLQAEYADHSRGLVLEEASAAQLEAFLAHLTAEAKQTEPAEEPAAQAPAGQQVEQVPSDDEIEDAVVVDDEDPGNQPVAKERLTSLNIAIGERGITPHTGKGSTAANKAAKAAWLNTVIKRRPDQPAIESTADLTEREADIVWDALRAMPVTHPTKKKAAQQAQQQEQDPAARRAYMLDLFGQLGIRETHDILRDISIITGDQLTAAAPPTPEQIEMAIAVLEAAKGDINEYDALIEVARAAEVPVTD